MTSNGTITAGREIVISRVIDAPRELVFDAFTDREHIAEWWGPNGFTTTIHAMEVRPGAWPTRITVRTTTRRTSLRR